jgi:ribosomal protein L37AE/L43A
MRKCTCGRCDECKKTMIAEELSERNNSLDTRDQIIERDRILNTRDRNSCPDCGSLHVYHRKSSNKWICRKCGWIGDNPRKTATKCYKTSDSRIDKIIRGTSTS